jgi:sulfate adenylyltransferase subunit 1 (EFTu-like GTPase family)
MVPLYMLLERENITAKRYKYVLQQLFIPFYKRMRAKYGDEVVMQEDNAPWHTTKIITKYLENRKVRQMKWPPSHLISILLRIFRNTSRI